MRIILFVFILISETALSQGFSLHIGSGIGTYSMSQLKDYEKTWSNQFSPLELKITDDFNPSLYYDFQFRKNFSSGFLMGVVYRYLSSGVRSSYEDYSGFIEHTQRTDGNSVGILLGYRTSHSSRASMNVGIETYYTWTHYVEEQTVVLSGSPTPFNDSFNHESKSVIINPFLEGQYTIGIPVFSLKFGYSFDTKGDPLPTDWSGFRFGLGVGVKF
jgi:hypothetical protein